MANAVRTISEDEPRTLAEMHARKREADRRQSEAAARLKPVPNGAPEEAASVTPPPEQFEELANQASPAIDPQVDAQIRATLGSVIDRAPRRIIAKTAAQYGQTYEAVVGEARDAAVLEARDAALIALREAHPKRSLPWYGKQMGGRDHTTILHAFRKLGLTPEPPRHPALAALQADARGMRAIEPLELSELVPASVVEPVPVFRSVDPRTLLVDQAYQRGLSEQSLKLIRRIVSEWSWRAFKPPIVVEGEDALHVIDGQHTAIAAATHPDITEIPVMVVQAVDRAARAEAFVRHNRDRLHISGVQMHISQAAAGDPVALGVEEACRLAGARILRSNTSMMRYRPGDTIAIEVLTRIVRRHGIQVAADIIGTCVEGDLAPVRAEALRAVEVLLSAPEHSGAYDRQSLATTFRTLGPELSRKAALFAATHRVARWQADMAVLAQATKRIRPKL